MPRALLTLLGTTIWCLVLTLTLSMSEMLSSRGPLSSYDGWASTMIRISVMSSMA